jgi:hypothetical protein
MRRASVGGGHYTAPAGAIRGCGTGEPEADRRITVWHTAAHDILDSGREFWPRGRERSA